MRKLPVVCAAALLLAGCGSSAVLDTAWRTGALAKWESFPATADPRPIVWIDGPALIQGFPSGDAKIAASCKKLELGPGVVLPAQGPDRATARWPNGEVVSYSAITAADAFAGWKAMPGMKDGSICEVPALVVTAVRWGTTGFSTDRGRAQMSAWLFDVAGVGTFEYPGVARDGLWGGTMTTNANATTVGVTSADDRTLTLHFIGGPSEGGCRIDYTPVSFESTRAVAVQLVAKLSANGAAACDAVGYAREATLTLKAPLGGRVLVDQGGNVSPVCAAETAATPGDVRATC